MPQTERLNALFSKLQLGPYELANRIVMAPMTRNRAGDGNVPTELNALYYQQRATAPLIITEASQISPQGVGYPGTPGIHSDAQAEGWKQVIKAVHDEGSRIFLQLWHVGRISHPSLQPDGAIPVAPSAIQPAGEAITFEGMQPFVTPRALETDEIPGIVADYRAAAERARATGFDGVEIHAANGYLLDQFLRDQSNQRDDAYGGSVENRMRFLLEVTEAVTGVWGADRVGLRLSPVNSFNDIADSAPEATFVQIASALAETKLAYLHMLEGDLLDPEAGLTFHWGALRKAFGGLYMANGGYDGARANATIAEGNADLIAFARPFISNPDLVARLAKGATLAEPDPNTFYGGDATGYTDYPTL